MENIWGRLLRMAGWKVDITAPRLAKCVICVAPHTSNWDFVIGLFAYKSLGRNANFLMKEFWFFWPLKYLLLNLGGIPVPRNPKKKKGSLTENIIEAFGRHDYLNLAVTPEGTRSRRTVWKRGFLYIANGAGVPVQLGIIDYHTKTVIIRDQFTTTGDIDRDMRFVKDYYSHWHEAAKHPENFTTSDQ